MLAQIAIDWTAIALAVVGAIIGVFGWFVNNMHKESKSKLESIDKSLQPLAIIGHQVGTLTETVKDHVKILPELKTDVAVIKEKQAHHGGKIETISDEVSRLREWRHDVSNALHSEGLKRVVTREGG